MSQHANSQRALQQRTSARLVILHDFRLHRRRRRHPERLSAGLQALQTKAPRDTPFVRPGSFFSLWLLCQKRTDASPFYFIVLIFRGLRLTAADNYLLRSISLEIISCEKMRTLLKNIKVGWSYFMW